MSDLIDRLRDMPCDREPFTADHKDCICRLTNAAADEIEKLRSERTAEREACAKTIRDEQDRWLGKNHEAASFVVATLEVLEDRIRARSTENRGET